MAQTIKQLGQARPADTNVATLYTAPASTRAVVQVNIAHTGATDPVKFRVFNDDNGTTADETTAIAWDTEIRPGEKAVVGGIMMGDNQGTIRVRTDTANELTFTAYGVEIT